MYPLPEPPRCPPALPDMLRSRGLNSLAPGQPRWEQGSAAEQQEHQHQHAHIDVLQHWGRAGDDQASPHGGLALADTSMHSSLATSLGGSDLCISEIGNVNASVHC